MANLRDVVLDLTVVARSAIGADAPAGIRPNFLRLLHRGGAPAGTAVATEGGQDRPPTEITAPSQIEGPIDTAPQCGAPKHPAADRWSTDLLRSDDEARSIHSARAESILDRHRRQTPEIIDELRRRYGAPVFGQARVWDLILRLGRCVDPTDRRLYGASQLVHVMQMLSAMEADGTATPEMVLATLIHDLGKVLLLTDEDPANVACMNSPVGHNEEGAGLENCLFQWNHDEFAYDRMKDLVSADTAWLIRYHSIEIAEAHPLMDEDDIERLERLLIPFAHYDHATKSPYLVPAEPLSRYRDLIEEAFPDPITF